MRPEPGRAADPSITGEVNCRVVYCGPPASGKTANLRHLHQCLHPDTRGKLITGARVERRFPFDFLAVDLGAVRGYRTRLHLYTVPGRRESREGRHRILEGADGVVLVADSDGERLDDNRKAWRELEADLAALGRRLESLPLAVQYNKRDHPRALPVDELEKELNTMAAPSFPAVATRGEGVVETVETVGVLVVRSLHDREEPG